MEAYKSKNSQILSDWMGAKVKQNTISNIIKTEADLTTIHRNEVTNKHNENSISLKNNSQEKNRGQANKHKQEFNKALGDLGENDLPTLGSSADNVKQNNINANEKALNKHQSVGRQIKGENWEIINDGEYIYENEIPIEIEDWVRKVAGINDNEIVANLSILLEKHPENFKTRADVFRLIKEVKDNPTHFYVGSNSDNAIISKQMNDNKIGAIGIEKNNPDKNMLVHANKTRQKARENLNNINTRQLGGSPLNPIVGAEAKASLVTSSDIIPQNQIKGDNFVMNESSQAPYQYAKQSFQAQKWINDLSGVLSDEWTANLKQLAIEHPEMFQSEADVFRVIKEIKDNPSHFFKNYRDDVALIGKKLDNQNKAGNIGIVKETGEIIHANKTKEKDLSRLARRNEEMLTGTPLPATTISDTPNVAGDLLQHSNDIIPQNKIKGESFIAKGDENKIIHANKRRLKQDETLGRDPHTLYTPVKQAGELSDLRSGANAHSSISEASSDIIPQQGIKSPTDNPIPQPEMSDFAKAELEKMAVLQDNAQPVAEEAPKLITNEKELLEYADNYFAYNGIDVKLGDFKAKSTKPRTYFSFEKPNLNDMELRRFQHDLEQKGLRLEPNGANSYSITYAKKPKQPKVKIQLSEQVEEQIKEIKSYPKEWDYIHNKDYIHSEKFREDIKALQEADEILFKVPDKKTSISGKLINLPNGIKGVVARLNKNESREVYEYSTGQRLQYIPDGTSLPKVILQTKTAIEQAPKEYKDMIDGGVVLNDIDKIRKISYSKGTDKFYIPIIENGVVKAEQITGMKIAPIDGYTLYARQSTINGKWGIYEESTGLLVSEGKTRKEAIQKVKTKFAEYKEQNIKLYSPHAKMLKKAKQEQGIVDNQANKIYAKGGDNLAAGLVSGVEEDENGNLSINPAKFIAGLGGYTVAKKMLTNPKVQKELKNVIGEQLAKLEARAERGDKLAQGILGQNYLFTDPHLPNGKYMKGAFSDTATKQVLGEIDDRGAKLILKKDETWTELENILSHDELYKKYPELKHMPTHIKIDKDAQSYGAYTPFQDRGEDYYPITEEINIFATDIDTAKSMLLHEIQHAIQAKEKWARGGNPNDFTQNAFQRYKNLHGEQMARATQHRANMSPDERIKESYTDTLKRVEGEAPEPIIKYGDNVAMSESLKKDLMKSGVIRNDLNSDITPNLPKGIYTKDEFVKLVGNNKKITIKTPIEKLNIDVNHAWGHIDGKNKYRQKRHNIAGAFLDTLKEPLFVVKNAEQIEYYKLYKFDNKTIGLTSITKAKNGKLQLKTFFEKYKSTLEDVISKTKEENILYYRLAGETKQNLEATNARLTGRMQDAAYSTFKSNEILPHQTQKVNEQIAKITNETQADALIKNTQKSIKINGGIPEEAFDLVLKPIKSIQNKLLKTLDNFGKVKTNKVKTRIEKINPIEFNNLTGINPYDAKDGFYELDVNTPLYNHFLNKNKDEFEIKTINGKREYYRVALRDEYESEGIISGIKSNFFDQISDEYMKHIHLKNAYEQNSLKRISGYQDTLSKTFKDAKESKAFTLALDEPEFMDRLPEHLKENAKEFRKLIDERANLLEALGMLDPNDKIEFLSACI